MKKITITLAIIISIITATAQTKSAEFNNKFAFDFYRQLAENKDNIFFSPYSISLAMAMTYQGAEDATAKDIQKVMHYPDSKEDLRKAFSNDKKEIANPEFQKYYTLKIANAIWACKKIKLRKKFINTIERCYKAPIFRYAFGKDFKIENLKNEVNSWTEKNTEEKIKNLLQSSDIDPSTVMIIVNAIYFKSKWANEFNKRNTKDDVFYGKTERVRTKFMNATKHIKYYKDSNIIAVEMPYAQHKNSMYIIMPTDKQGFDKLKYIVDYEYCKKIVKNATFRDVKLSIPKFKTENRLYLKNEMRKMGMTVPFTPQANFRGITKSKEIYINKIIHQSFIEVDEAGTEAAAATAVVMKRVTSLPPSARETVFKADRPFMYLITNNITNNILFMGQITNLPRQNGKSTRRN